MKETTVKNEPKTDQEVYDMLKQNTDDDFMKATEWRRLRLKQLKAEGKQWSY